VRWWYDEVFQIMIDAQEKSQWKKWKDAAQHCGVSESWLRSQIKAGNGPKYLHPSPRLILFREQDLNDWMASWRVVSK
jgi:predicted DNA-binding transcriptional regulator AlpA